ncbi:MAG: HD family phosphohydrolase [Planctomycetes bacterium]|nr:HD family phosphohydrolase [Planctomycetota bacterium]
MSNKKKLDSLRKSLESLYRHHNNELLFHGWHHIAFVEKKAIEFAQIIDADLFLVDSAALTHDLNFIVEKNSEPERGIELRWQYLTDAGYQEKEIKKIEEIIKEAHTASRSRQISAEGKALSDADTLFKSLPITPVIFSSKYISENKIDINKLAKKIVSEQSGLMDDGIYFYTDVAKEKYLKWATVNLDLWKSIGEALQDEDVKELLRMARVIGIV